MEYPTQPTAIFTPAGHKRNRLSARSGWLASLSAWWLRVAAPAPRVDPALLAPEERHTLRRGALLAWLSLGLLACTGAVGLGEAPHPSVVDLVGLALIITICLLALGLLNRRGHVDIAAVVILVTAISTYAVLVLFDVKSYGGFDVGTMSLLTVPVLIGALVMRPPAGFVIPLSLALVTELALIAVLPRSIFAGAIPAKATPVGGLAFDLELLLLGSAGVEIATAIIATAANRIGLLALRELDWQTGALQVREAYQRLIQEGDEAILAAFNAFVYDGERTARGHLPDGHPRQHLANQFNLLLDQLDQAYRDVDMLQLADRAWTEQGRFWRRLPQMHAEREQLGGTAEEALAAGVTASVYASTSSYEPAQHAIESLRAWETYREHELLAASMTIISAIHRRLSGQAGARVPDTVARSSIAPLAHEVNRLLDLCDAPASGNAGPKEPA